MADWCDGFLKVQSEFPTPLYPADQAGRLRALVAGAATGPAADPEGALSLAWAYRTLTEEARGKFPEDRLAPLGAVIPLNVRVAPYTVKGPTPRPDTAQFGPRMRAVNAFDAARFGEAFRVLVGGK